MRKELVFNFEGESCYQEIFCTSSIQTWLPGIYSGIENHIVGLQNKFFDETGVSS